ncbi:MAG: helix-turn-helix domain-containing protein [Pseudomonadota bacterium]
MERKKFNTSPCSIARSLDVLGDWWKPLILRECLYGNARFDSMQFWLGISRNILTRRLTELIDEGLLRKQAYQDKPVRYEYRLTEKGHDACQILLALMPFGERWFFEQGKHPIELRDRKTGERVVPMVVDANTGKPLDSRNLVPCPGPGFEAPHDIVKRRFVEFFESD